MKLMDRYLVQGFLKPFGVCVIIFCLLVILGRFFDKMGVFTAYHARPIHIIEYLALSLPLWLNLVLPIASLLALLFALGQHQQQGEITAFRSAGIPSWRLYRPYFSIGAILVVVSLIGGLTFLPTINYKSRAVYRVKIKKEALGRYKTDRIVAAGRNHMSYAIGWLDLEKNEMKDVIVDRFDDNTKLVETISASRAMYRNGQWTFYNGKRIVYDVSQLGAFGEKNFKKEIIPIEESPRDFALQEQDPESMTAKETVERIKRLRLLGVPSSREEVALHMKIALPFAHLVVIALGIPFALRSQSKGKVQTFGYALVIAFLYWGTVSACQSLGEQGHLPAWLAAWMANFIFFVLAFVLLRRV